jgi:hypothetical protein
VLDLVDDYDAARLGNIRELPKPLVEYVKVASSEYKKWQAHWENKLMKAKRG